MLRCIQLAKNGLGTTAPNPTVGAVIVYNNIIIGEGFTSAFGGAHAEANAINAVGDKKLLALSTLYVTLEPCSHHGKTPPCADLIIAHKIPRIVIGLKDPHAKVAGQGIARLERNGCITMVGVLENACAEHHKRFLTFHTKKRPYIILKWATTLDGFIAPLDSVRTNTPQPYWITGKLAKQLVHKWRSEEQSILVGTTTALMDNPKLDVRLWKGKSPIKIVIDRALKVPKTSALFKSDQKTLLFTDRKSDAYVNTATQIEIKGNTLPQFICETLYQQNIQSVFIEGGAKTLQSFIDANLWDEARILAGNSSFKDGTASPQIKGNIQSESTLNKDRLTILRNDT